MTLQANIVKTDRAQKLAKLYNAEGFTKEQMATELFESGASYEFVVRVSTQMDYCK